MGADVYNAVGDLFYSSAESALEGIERRARRLFALREMSDMTLSALARSMRPFKNARFVNSPGPAG